MPRRLEPAVRYGLISKHCCTYYYDYRNDERRMSPTVQEEIRNLFRKEGWQEEIHFDSYIEDYDW